MGGASLLVSRNIGLKNQNNYLFDKYKETGKEYVDIATKYDSLKMKKYMDSMQVGLQHCTEILNMQYCQLKLIYQNDSIQNESINLAKDLLEISQKKRDLFEQFNIMTQAKEFYKKYARYLDSLLIQSEFSKVKWDSLVLINFIN